MSPGAEPLLPGDRLPDVRLSTPDGRRRRLHGDLAGRPLWLFLPGQGTVGLPAPLPGTQALWLASEPVADGVPDGWQAVVADARWCERLRGDAAAREGVAWVADANLRLRRRGDAALFDPADPSLASPSGAAPVLIVPDVFEADLCAELVRYFLEDCQGGEPSGVVVYEQARPSFVIDPEIKLRREALVREPALEQRMHERLARRALPEIERVFQFRTARRDPFKLLGYDAGAGYFRPHRDNETPDVAHRRFALSINLNAGDYAGGEFRYPEFGPALHAPATGEALVFSCSLLHEVTPVVEGRRLAMTTFLA